MRISTNILYSTGVSRITDLQSSLSRTQEQIATGRRIVTPSDDPVGAAQVLLTNQAKSANEQFALNRRDARNLLATEEAALHSVGGLLQDAKTLIVQAGNAALDDTQRKFLATELEGIFDQLMGLANSQDGTGNYIFGGYQSTQQPFAKSATGATYSGDQGERKLQVAASRQLSVSDSGAGIFEMNKTGNGRFLVTPGTNSGSAIASPGTVINAAALTGNNYTVTFTVAAGVTSYDVVNTTTGTTLSSGNAYTAGQAISFDGMQFEVSGAPADGDQFTLGPSKNQSVFTTFRDLIDLLNTPAGDAAARAALTNGLQAANGNISNALDNVLTVRAGVGIRMKEIDTLDQQGTDLDIQYEKEIEQLQGLDYVKAITDLTKQKIMLDAAQQSFIKTSGLSLFDYLR